MLVPVQSQEYAGILDWFKNLFGGHSQGLEDLSPEQKRQVQQLVSSAQRKGLLFGAVIGALAVYFLLRKGSHKTQQAGGATA